MINIIKHLLEFINKIMYSNIIFYGVKIVRIKRLNLILFNMEYGYKNNEEFKKIIFHIFQISQFSFKKL